MKLKLVQNRIRPNLRRKTNRLKTVAKHGYDVFRKTTPIRTGNARSSTEFKPRARGYRIEANYEYANRLNEGYSKQAPKGMTEPTIQEMQKKARETI